MTRPGTSNGVAHERGDVFYRATRFERKIRHSPEVSRSQMEATLDQLDPWLERHYDRILT